MTAEEIKVILANHAMWLQGADLRGADLQGADLRGADLRETTLCNADLHSATISFRGKSVRVIFSPMEDEANDREPGGD